MPATEVTLQCGVAVFVSSRFFSFSGVVLVLIVTAFVELFWIMIHIMQTKQIVLNSVIIMMVDVAAD